LLGIWRSMADTAKQDFAMLAIEHGMSIADIAAQLGRSISEITEMLDDGDGLAAGGGVDRC
jgi:hypothetical protein